MRLSKKYKRKIKSTALTIMSIVTIMLVMFAVNKQTNNSETMIASEFLMTSNSESAITVSTDKLIYISQNNGDDTAGTGTKNAPYKTLEKIAESGIIETGYTYGIVLSDGEYELTESIFTLNCNKSIHIIGNKQNTTLKVISLYENTTGGGSTAYSVNFYRLVWNGTYAGTNTIFVKNNMNFYNVAFKLDFSEGSYSYFIPTGSIYLYNCVLPTYVTNLLRTTNGTIKLTNCYGGFTSGYGTTDDTWNYQTNYITNIPSVDTTTYQITDAESVWKNVGTGTNFSDGQTSNLGVYGGDYDWNSDVEIEAIKVYEIKDIESNIEIGDELNLEIVETTGQEENPNESEWTWSSSDESVATVDNNGKVIAVNAGTVTITASNEQKESILQAQLRVQSDKNIFMNFDKVIYISEGSGDDTLGAGTKEAPYKTLAKIAETGIIKTGYTYGIVLDDGQYELTENIFTLNCDESINIIGNKENTNLKVTSLFKNSSGGSVKYSVNLYRLVWNGTEAATNAIDVQNDMNLYNVAFKLDFSVASTSYLNPQGSTYSLYNCVLPKNITNLLRTTHGTIKLTNCYGGFTSGYSTTDDTWNYQTNYITSTPLVDTTYYEITDDESIWKNVGTGTNYSDNKTSNLGVYGGEYDWYSDIVLQAYTIKDIENNLEKGHEVNLEIINAVNQEEDPNESEWTWSSSNESIATVDSNGKLTVLDYGEVIITVTNNEDIVITKKIRIKDITKIDIDVDKLIYISEIYGDDTAGNGTINEPYQTLNKISETGIIEKGYSYGIVLDDGEYELTTSIFTLSCSDSIHIIGNKENTILKSRTLYGNSSGGSTAYSVNFYRLVWKGTGINSTYGDTNSICIKNNMNFYNVVFKLTFTEGTYGYLFPQGSTYNLYNCVLPTYVTDLLRTTGGTIKLTNCYGGFTSGYNTADASWNYQTNHVTSTPSVDTTTYQITDDEAIWKNVGTGVNFSDGEISNLGVYGGEYDWNADIGIEQIKKYELNYRNEYIRQGSTLALELNQVGKDIDINEAEWIWSSSNEDVANVDENGVITANEIGTTTITGKNSQDDLKVRAIINVYSNKDGAITVPQVISQFDSTIILKEDGTVWSSGRNNYGQLGNGTTTDSNFAVRVKIDEDTYLSNIKKISCSLYHTLALTTDGKVYSWGYNSYAQLGVGDTEKKVYATEVILEDKTPLNNIIDISVGEVNSIFITNEGSTYVCGGNSNNQLLGVTTSTTVSYPTLLFNAGGIKAVSGDRSCGQMLSNGRTIGWGLNAEGQFGTGTTTSPLGRISLGKEIVDISLGGHHSVILKEDGTVWTTGYNNYGQLGNETTTDSAEFVQPTLPTDEEGNTIKVKYIIAGASSTQIISQEGKVYVTGFNGLGQLSQGDTTTLTSFTSMKNEDKTELSNAILIATGPHIGASSTLGTYALIKEDGTVWVSGDNTYGQIGNETNTSTTYLTRMGDGDGFLNYPEKVVTLGINESKQINSMLFNIQEDMNVFVDNNSELGELTYTVEDETTATVTSLGLVTGNKQGITKIKVEDSVTGAITNIWVKVVEEQNIEIDLGAYFTVALKQDGTVWSWGQNDYGELGLGNTTTYNEPREITGITEKITDVKAGYNHSIALTENGEVYTWGYNNYGQIGNGTKENALEPVKISGLTNIVKIDAYKYMTIALTESGEVYAWGNGYGSIPVKVSFSRKIIDLAGDVVLAENRRAYNLTETKVYGKDLIKISAGANHYLGLTSDGEVFAWGTNTYGQLGNGNNTSSSIPTKVLTADGTENITNIVEISAGVSCSIISDKDGNVYTFGYNGNYRIPTENTTNLPVKIENMNTVELVAASEGIHTAIVNWGGYVYTAGANDKGQLGLADFEERKTFEMIGGLQIASTPGKIAMYVGESEEFSLSLGSSFNLKSDTQNIGDVSRSIVNKTVATLTENTITGLSVGKTTLNATYEGEIEGLESDINKFYRNIEVEVLPEGGKVVPKVETGDGFTVILKADGTIWSFGQNEYGQLGVGDRVSYNEPQNVKIVEETVKDISVGDYHVLALSESGKVYSWGLGDNGQLGVGDSYNYEKPVVVKDINGKEIEDIVKVEAGKGVSFGVTSKGVVYAWGNGYSNRAQELDIVDNIIDVTSKYVLTGDGTVYNIETKEALAIVGKVVEIDEGTNHTVMLTEDQKAYAIGDNTYGQLVNGNNVPSEDTAVAVRVDSENIFTGIKEIKAGDRVTTIVTTEGKVWTAGMNDNYELGIENTEVLDRNLPEVNVNISNVIFANAGYNHIVVIKEDGTVYAWGNGKQGELGSRINKNSIIPVMVGEYTIRSNKNHIVQGVNDEIILKSYVDYFNVLKNEIIPITFTTKDTSVANVINITNEEAGLTEEEIQKGYYAVKVIGVKTGTTNIVATESQTNGIGVIQTEILPEANTTISPMVETKGSHIVTLKTNGTVWTYGQNTYGQLGIGTLDTEDEPMQVTFEEGTKIVEIAVGENHSVALDEIGNVWTWGRNNYYQLGVSNVSYSANPIKLTGIPKATKISAGNNSVMIITEDNKMYGWGQNAYGELANGTYSNRSLPTIVEGMHDVLDIEGGKTHYIVLKTNGNIYGVGSNLYSQLGIDLGEKTRVNTFEKIEMPFKVGDISASWTSSMAVTLDGQTYIWGQNTYGNLGTNDKADVSRPTKIEINNVVQGEVGKVHSILRDYNGSVYLAGTNSYGQLGDKTLNSKYTFTKNTEIENVLRIASGNTYTAVILTDGTVWAWGDYNHGNKLLKSSSNSRIPVQIGCNTSSLEKIELVVRKSEIISIIDNSEPKFNLIYEDETKASDYSYQSLNSDIATVNEDGNVLGIREGSTWVKVTDKETGKVNVAIVRVIENVEGYTIYTAPKIETGENFAVSLKEDGNINVWGYEDSQMVDSSVPEQINVVATYKDVKAGNNYILALRNDGTVWTAGYNANGQLGLGDVKSRDRLVQIPILTEIEQIAAGEEFAVAIDKYGLIYVWGAGYTNSPEILDTNIRNVTYLEAGDTNQIVMVLPTGEVQGFGSILNGKIEDLENAVKVEVGNGYLLILNTNGEVFKYENNTLTKVENVQNAIDISVKEDVNMYQNKDEVAYVWGANNYGQLGINGTSSEVINPILPINNSKNVFSIAAGKKNTYITETTGLVYTAGDNTYGQIGNGTKEDTESNTYKQSLTHTLVGDRNFEITPLTAIMEVNDVENITITSTTYNVFRYENEKDISEYTMVSNDESIEVLTDEESNLTGYIKAISEGSAEILVTDKVTEAEVTLTRKVVPLEQNRIKSITVNGYEAEGGESSNPDEYVSGYKVEVPLDDAIETGALIINTEELTDQISIDGGATFVEGGTLSQTITVEEENKIIPVIIKSENGTEFKYELTVERVNNNNNIQSITVNGYSAEKSLIDENTYEIIVTDKSINEVVVTSENENSKVSIKGEESSLNIQTYETSLSKGYAELPIKVTSESGKEQNSVLKIYTPDEMLRLKTIVVNSEETTLTEEGRYKAIISDDVSRSSITAETYYDSILIGINDCVKEVKTITRSVITTEEQTEAKIDLEATLIIDGQEQIIEKQYILDIYKNKFFSNVDAVTVNGEILEEENNSYISYILSSTQSVDIEIKTKEESYQITLGEDGSNGNLQVTKTITDKETVFEFNVLDPETNESVSYNIIVIRGEIDTSIKKITVGKEEYVIEAIEQEEQIEGKTVYEAKILDEYTNVDITVQTVNNTSKISINDKAELTTKLAIENVDLTEKETLIPILIKTEDEATSEEYVLKVVRQEDNTDISYITVDELVGGEPLNATLEEENDEEQNRYEVYLENATDKIQVNVETLSDYAEISINGKEKEIKESSEQLELTASQTEIEIEVVSENGTLKTYYLTVYTISDDTNISSITVDGKEAIWNNETRRYEIKVDRDILSYEVTATAQESKASINLDGTEEVLTVTKEIVNESEETIVEIVVTAANGITNNTSKLAIIEKSNNSNLGYVKVNGRVVNAEEDGSYKLEVVSSVQSILVEVGAEEPNASINVDGEVQTGVWKNTKEIQTDEEIYEIVITAEDGVTASETYKLNVIRLDGNTDIKDITLSYTSGEETHTINSTIKEDGTYYVKVPRVEEASVTVNLEQEISKVNVLGTENLQTVTTSVMLSSEKIEIPIIVTAEDGSKYETKLIIEKESTDTTLKTLTAKQLEISKLEDGTYQVIVDSKLEAIDLTVIPTNDYATIKLKEEDTYVSEFADKTIDITGKQKIEIDVLAEDGETTQTHILQIIRTYNTEIDIVTANGNQVMLGEDAVNIIEAVEQDSEIVVTAKETDAEIYLIKDGVEIATGIGTLTVSQSIPQEEVEEYTIKIQGPDEYAIYSEEYVLKIREKSTNVNAVITLNGETLVQDEETGMYKAEVKGSNHTIKVDTESKFAKVSINEDELTEQTQSKQFEIEAKQTMQISIKVNSENGETEEKIVEIYRKNDNAEIESVQLKLEEGDDGEELQKQEDGNYYKKVKRNQTSVIVTLTAIDSKAVANINSVEETKEVTVTINVPEEDEKINIPLKVTAEDGTENITTLVIEKQSKDTTLSKVEVKDGTSSKISEQEYSISVDSRETSIVFTAIPSNENASIKFEQDENYVSTLNGVTVDIDGKESFGVDVLAEDGETTSNYIIKIIRIFDTSLSEVMVDKESTIKDKEMYIGWVNANEDNHTIEIKADNSDAVMSLLDEDENILASGIGVLTYNDTVLLDTKNYNIKVEGAEGYEEYVSEYVLTLNKKSKDTTSKIYINGVEVQKDEESGMFEVGTTATSNTLTINTNNSYATIEISGNVYTHTYTEVYELKNGESKEIVAKVISQNGETEEYKINIIKLSSNTNIDSILVNNEAPTKVDEGLYRSVQSKEETNGKVEITLEDNLATVIATVDESTYEGTGEIEFDVDLEGKGTKEIQITITAQDGTTRNIELNIVQNTSVNINVIVKVNDVEVQKIDDSAYQIFVDSNVGNSVTVELLAEDEYATVTHLEETSNTISYQQSLDEEGKAVVEFSATSEAEETKDYVLYIMKESTDNTIGKLYVNEMEITKGENGRYTAYIENTLGNPIVKVQTNNEYAYVRIGTYEEEAKVTEKTVELQETRTTTVPITIRSQSGESNVEYLDINVTFVLGNIDLLIVDDEEIVNYDEETKTYVALVDNAILEHEIYVVSDNNYVTLELGESVGIGNITTSVTMEKEVEELTLYVTGETDLTTTYTIILAQKSTDIGLKEVKVNDVSLLQDENKQYHKEIEELAEKAKIRAITTYPYATVKVGDQEVQMGDSQDVWIDLVLNQDEIVIPVVVTAADGTTIETYNIILKRTENTIKGKVITENWEEKHIAKVTVYRTGDTREENDEVNPREVIAQVMTIEDGSYSINVPKVEEYDIVIQKDGYLETRITNIMSEQGTFVEVEEIELIAGDIDNSGEIEIFDLVGLNDNCGITVNHEDGGDDENVIYDFNEDGLVDKLDRDILKANYGKVAEIIEWIDPDLLEATTLMLERTEEDFILPMSCDYVITSEYGMRIDPIEKVELKHTGIDISGIHHTEIYAVAEGEVTYAGVKGGYGNCVEIKHIVNGETIYSFYAHLSRIDVEEGQSVEQGEVIGLEGGDPETDPNAGNSTGHHLHFEIRTDSGYGNDVDPTDYIDF